MKKDELFINKFRKSQWYDSKRNIILYGIDGQVEKGKWCHLRTGDDLHLYETKIERDLVLKHLKEEQKAK